MQLGGHKIQQKDDEPDQNQYTKHVFLLVMPLMEYSKLKPFTLYVAISI